MSVRFSWKQTRDLLTYIDVDYIYNTIHMYSGITSGRVLNGELLYAKILEANLSAYISTDCFMKISPQSSEQIQIEEKFSSNSLQINQLLKSLRIKLSIEHSITVIPDHI